MANVLINEDTMSDIADAIRAKKGVSTTYKPREMPSAIESISGGGGITPTGTINITTNGTHDVTNYASANVAVPTGSTPTGTKQISITSNGTTTEDVTAYANAQITVNVSSGSTASLHQIGSTYEDTNAKVTVSGNHVRIEVLTAWSNMGFNLRQLGCSSKQTIFSMSEWFVLPTGQVEVAVTNITNASGIEFAFNAKLSNSTTGAGLATSAITDEQDVIATFSINSSMSIGCWYVWLQTASAGAVVEFDLTITVNGVRYI